MAARAADVFHNGAELAERCVAAIEAVSGDPRRAEPCAVDVGAHQLAWSIYMTTGAPRFRAAVLRSLSAVCDAWLRAHDGRAARPGLRLADTARLLELSTWVWRVERRAELRRGAEAMVERAVAELRVPGRGFAASVDVPERARVCPVDANGLMVVALVEGGSVFERRDWLVLAREVFEEIADATASELTRASRHRLDDQVMMSRAAIRLFEAFGKQRTLDLARTWMTAAAIADDWTGIVDELPPSSGVSLMAGVLARLHALTGDARDGERADALVETLRPSVARAGIAGAAAVETARTVAWLLSIRVSGDPRRADTRELMRVALDCGLPDRLVLGPGAGGTRGEGPLAHIRLGSHPLAPIEDAARLRALLAPGGLAGVFRDLDPARNC